MSGSVVKRPGIADGDHRHRAVAATRDDAAALERVEREVDLLAAGADDRARREPAGVVERAEDDAAADRQDVERRPHAGRRRFFRRVLVVPAEPAGRDERRPLGRPQVRLALAGPLLLGLVLRRSRSSRDRTTLLGGVEDEVRDRPRRLVRVLVLDHRHAGAMRARATMNSCRRRMSSKRSR